MIIHNVEQGSPEWTALRLGIPTASCFAKILTPKEWKLSKSAGPYMRELIAEWVLGYSPKDDTTLFMDRGHQLEPEAIAHYEMQKDCDVRRVGFITNDAGTVGCSPDGLIGKDGGLEVKCPGPIAHLGYLLDGDFSEYRCQIQGGLWIADREWWDFESYHPNLPPLIERVYRNDVMIQALSSAVAEFTEKLGGEKDRLRAMGCIAALDQVVAA